MRKAQNSKRTVRANDFELRQNNIIAHNLSPRAKQDYNLVPDNHGRGVSMSNRSVLVYGDRGSLLQADHEKP